ncbi:MAG: uracil-DNA glycosylase [Candidatus Methanomethylicota archaeon]|uniref:Uracil-DNA glycosylase n=1 Tax=Thermoproteota archaeon TaxID=2056631 RepID=A0A523B8C6_9CREN|nr:MAG: uracil-DNA glycosylase [Candidatus Verstraetearchaeota archaeon]
MHRGGILGLLEFQSKLKGCRYCRDVLGLKFEPKPLVWGREGARIVVIGQAPSMSAGLCGRPFSKDLETPDASGRRLIEWLGVQERTFFDPDIFYITGVAHCYPGKGKGGDLPPPRVCAEMWLGEELSYLSPRLFVILGRYAASWAFPKRKFEDLVFEELEFRGRTAIVLPHPSPANRGWFKAHPEFAGRLTVLRGLISRALTDSVLCT